jgi:hypothetical protein
MTIHRLNDLAPKNRIENQRLTDIIDEIAMVFDARCLEVIRTTPDRQDQNILWN